MTWIPADENQLRDALDKGLLRECHTLDFKSGLEDTRSARRKFAKHLAQFAIDGGTLVLGVAEEGPPTLKPIALAGLKERVDQIARTIPDPPMHVRTETITCAEDSASGYLFVTVPSTPYEPRQVDGVYQGRGDTTGYALSAAEVER